MVNPKILRKYLNHLNGKYLNGLSKYFSVVQTNAIEDNKRLKYDFRSVTQTFAKSSNLAEYLLKNLRNSHNKFNMNSVYQYCKKLELKYIFNLTPATEINKF